MDREAAGRQSWGCKRVAHDSATKNDNNSTFRVCILKNKTAWDQDRSRKKINKNDDRIGKLILLDFKIIKFFLTLALLVHTYPTAF